MQEIGFTTRGSVLRLLETNPSCLLLPSSNLDKDFADDDVSRPYAVQIAKPPAQQGDTVTFAEVPSPISDRNKKRQERNKRRRKVRSADRLAKWKEDKDEAAALFRAEGTSFFTAKIGGGYFGSKTISTRGLTETVVPHAGGAAARITDADGRMFVYRGFKGAATDAANVAAIAAAKFASEALTSVQTDTKRGNFKKFYFIMHRESVKVEQHPRMHSYFVNNMGAGMHVAQLLQPVLRVAKAAFKQQFPALYDYYAAALRRVCENDASLIAPMFPFASFAINCDNVVALPHIDALNFGPGLCCIIPFGDFDPEQDCRIELVEAAVQVECGPGIPTFIPSALFTHCNTPLVTNRSRGSIVLWTNASIFQYYDLDCRPVNELTPQEKVVYDGAVQARIIRGIERFPLIAKAGS